MRAVFAFVLVSVTGASATEMRSRNMLRELEEYVGDAQRFASATEHADLQRAVKVARIMQNSNDDEKFKYFCQAGGGINAPLAGDERAVLKAWTEGLGLRASGNKPSRSEYCGKVERALAPMMKGGLMDKMRFCSQYPCPEKPPCKPMFPQPTTCGCPGKMKPLPEPKATIDIPIPMLPCNYNCICEAPPVDSGMPCQDVIPKTVAFLSGSGMKDMFSGTQLPDTSMARVKASCMIGKYLRSFDPLCREACYQKVLGNGNEADVLAVKVFYQAGCTIGCDKLTADMQAQVNSKASGAAEFESVLGGAEEAEQGNYDELDELMKGAEKYMAPTRKLDYKKLASVGSLNPLGGGGGGLPAGLPNPFG